MCISDWSSDVCSSDLDGRTEGHRRGQGRGGARLCGETGNGGAAAGLHRRRPDRRGRVRGGAGAGRRGCAGWPIPADGGALRTARRGGDACMAQRGDRSEEHTSEIQSLMRISSAVFCLKKKKLTTIRTYIKN